MGNHGDGDGTDDQSRRARESAWLQAIAAGGRAADKAMEALFETYQRKLRAALWNRRIPDGDAEDLTQRVWESVIRKLPRFPAGLAPGALVWRQFKDVVALAAREHGRSVPLTSESSGTPGEEGTESALSQVAATPLSEAALQEARDACVQDKLKQFERERESDHRLLVMVYYEGWGIPELAEHLGIKQGALRQRLLEARRRIKELMRPCHELEAE